MWAAGRVDRAESVGNVVSGVDIQRDCSRAAGRVRQVLRPLGVFGYGNVAMESLGNQDKRWCAHSIRARGQIV